MEWSYADEWGYDAITIEIGSWSVCVSGGMGKVVLRLLRVISCPLSEHPDKRAKSVHSISRNVYTISLVPIYFVFCGYFLSYLY